MDSRLRGNDATSVLQSITNFNKGDNHGRDPHVRTLCEIPYDKMTPEQQEGYRAMVEARGRLPGPNKIYVHNPKLAKVVGPFGAHFRKGYSLSEREREIAVNIVNSHWHSAYPTSSHEGAAKRAGLPAEKVEAILSGPADLVHRQARAGRLRDGDVPDQFALGIERVVRPRGRGPGSMSALPT
jgi:hypothetical protein